MLDAPLAVALAAGMVATVNPCGFALLPVYLTAFVGSDTSGVGRRPAGRHRPLARALAVSAVLTAGVVVVFGTFGLVVTPLALSIEQHLPWVTIAIGAAVVALGVAVLAGRSISVGLPSLGRLRPRRGFDGSLPSMFVFGVSFATASLSCTIGPFLAVTTATFRTSSVAAGLVVFVAYGLGMGIVIAAVTVALALANTAFVDRFRSALAAVTRLGGVLMIVAGTYVGYYGWFEIRSRDGVVDDPVIDAAMAVQQWLQRLIVPGDPATAATTWAAVLAVAVIVALAATRLRGRRAVPRRGRDGRRSRAGGRVRQRAATVGRRPTPP